MARRSPLLGLAVVLGLLAAAALLLLAARLRPALAAPAAAPAAGGLASAPALTLSAPDGQNFGSAVAAAGDVNGDGFTDIVVGDPLFGSSAGRVRVYHGTSLGLSPTPAITLTGAAGERLGESVSTAGDVNFDGFADVAIGASNHDAGAGRVYLHLGGAGGLAAQPAQSFSGEAGSRFGDEVAPAGDVNGDGFSDLVVGAPGYASQTGRAYVYHGGATGLTAAPVLTLTGEGTFTNFGLAVSTAGDVNADGFSDVVVGADWVSLSKGRAYVYHGSAGGLAATPALTLTGPANFHGLGGAVATAGDLNGDGFSDVVVGAVANNNLTGTAYIFLGSGGGLAATPALSLTGESAGDHFGSAVATAGDVNGDGYADLVVGAVQYPAGGFSGRAYVYHGGPSLSAAPVLTLTGSGAGAFAHALAPAGDVNGDGFADLAVGSRTEFGGRVRLYHGAAGSASPIAAHTVSGADPGSQLGWSVAAAGDVNADGFADVVVGAPGHKGGVGLANLHLGGAGGLDPDTPFPLYVADETGFGSAVSTAGDVNGDGFADVIVGAPASNGGRGRAYVFHGQAGGIDLAPALTLAGDGSPSEFGTSVASAGDVNGDGFADVLVGAPRFDNELGLASLFLGGASGLSPTPALTLTGEASLSYFGFAVASAGDVNADGFSDVVIGAPLYSLGAGRAYLYYGSLSGLRPTPALTLTGQGAASSFGFAVASAGDVNGDSFADVIFGATQYPAGAGAGRAYLHHGSGAGLSAVPALTLTGAAGHTLGYAFATGDVNGDGYADVVVGAPAGSLSGFAFVHHGGSAGLSAAPVVTLTGLSTGDQFGRAVGTADVNGDGYADVLAGLPGVDSETGQAHIFPGNEAYGLSHAQRARTASDGAPIAHLGQTGTPSTFRLAALGRTPFGRGLVALQWEVKPLGLAFDGQGLQQGAGWLTAPAAGVELNELAATLGLAPVQHWRVRFLYKTSATPYAQHSRWLTQPWNGWNESRLRTDRRLLFIPLVQR